MTRMTRRGFSGLGAAALGAAAAGLPLGSRAWAQSTAIDASKVPAAINHKATGKKFSIATVVKVDGIAWFDRMRVGVKQFGADQGYDTWMVGPSTTDAAAQVQIVEGLLAQGVDAICIVPFSVEAVEPVLAKARRQGIVVISHEAAHLQNTDWDVEAFDNHAYGEKLMQELARQMGGEGGYVATVGSLTSESQNEWVDGAVAYQQQHFPKMSQVTKRIETYDDATTDYNKLKEVLTTYPNLRGILGAPMPTSAGAGRLIAERGLKDKLFFSGTGLVSVAGKYLGDGDIDYIQFWDPATAGYAMNILAVMALTKQPIHTDLDLGLKGYDDLKTSDPSRPHVLYGKGWVGVTKANMSQYNF